MNNIIRLLFLNSIITVSMISCKKDPVSGNSMDRVYNISFSRNALQYVNIPVGKYFIYQTPGFAIVDSVIVVSTLLDTVKFPRNNNTGFPEHNIERFSLKMNKYVNPIGPGGAPSITEWLKATTLPQASSPYDSSSTADVKLELTGLYAGQTVFYGTHNLSGTQTLVVEGVTYNGVIKTESDNGLPVSDANYRKNTVYWAKDIGIIKRITTVFNGHEIVSNLIRRG